MDHIRGNDDLLFFGWIFLTDVKSLFSPDIKSILKQYNCKDTLDVVGVTIAALTRDLCKALCDENESDMDTDEFCLSKIIPIWKTKKRVPRTVGKFLI